MSSTRDIRRRIRSIKNTHQITKAMEMVAAAKMRKTQKAALATRTYADLAWELLQRVSLKGNPKIHKLLKQPEKTEKAAIVLITSNRGLIGSFNTNIISTALGYAKQYPAVQFITLGKRGRDAVRKRGFDIAADFEKLDAVETVEEIAPLSNLVVEDFASGKYDKVVLVYMDFVSTLVQKPRIRELLPLVQSRDSTLGDVGNLSPSLSPRQERGVLTPTSPPGEGGIEGRLPTDYLFEPTPDLVLETLLPRLTETQIYQALLETNASEHSARMVAMKNASDAAADLVGELTLEFNKIRQAAITKEISEIVSGQLAVSE